MDRRGSVRVDASTAECLSPVGTLVEAVCVVEFTAPLMSKKRMILRRLRCLRRVVLDPFEPRVGEVERNADEGGSVGASPLVAEIDRV